MFKKVISFNVRAETLLCLVASKRLGLLVNFGYYPKIKRFTSSFVPFAYFVVEKENGDLSHRNRYRYPNQKFLDSDYEVKNSQNTWL